MILAFESSCDDTALSLLDLQNGNIIWHKKLSQEKDHARWGGVVPELAARLHAQALPELLSQVKPYFSQLKAVASTMGPGLNVSLIEGILMAKLVAITLNLPFIGIDHLKGHVHSLFINKPTQFPLHVLLVSGGHTLVLEAQNSYEMTVLATTMDDSFGESFDKCAKMLGLTYPGGPLIEQYAHHGNPYAYEFSIPLKHTATLAFSYSGLKNSVRLAIEKHEKLTYEIQCDICASFQRVAVEHLLNRLEKIFALKKPKILGIVGGASANLYLREKLQNVLRDWECELYVAPLEYCADNAAMIARIAWEHYKDKKFDDPLLCQSYTRSAWI